MFLKITLAAIWKANCTAKVEVVRPFKRLLQKTKGRWKYLGLINVIAVEVLGSGQIEDALECKTDMLLDS